MSLFVFFLYLSLSSLICSLIHRTFGSLLNHDFRFICSMHRYRQVVFVHIQVHLCDWSAFSFLRSPWDRLYFKLFVLHFQGITINTKFGLVNWRSVLFTAVNLSCTMFFSSLISVSSRVFTHKMKRLLVQSPLFRGLSHKLKMISIFHPLYNDFRRQLLLVSW